jgi:hypothetical protein
MGQKLPAFCRFRLPLAKLTPRYTGLAVGSGLTSASFPRQADNQNTNDHGFHGWHGYESFYPCHPYY